MTKITAIILFAPKSALVVLEFAKPQRGLFAGKGEGGARPSSCPPSIFMVQFRVLALKDTCAFFVESVRQSRTAYTVVTVVQRRRRRQGRGLGEGRV